MNHISLGNLEKLISVTIVYLDQTSKYSVRVTGQRNDGSELAGMLEVWDTFEEANICARGIIRMFERLRTQSLHDKIGF